MGKKGKKLPTVDELLERPWCYYCERDFDDLKILLSHQKAKHFKCNKCGRRLNTAGGLSVHMNQVHKESLPLVENALPTRQGLDIEIFGMEGVPDDVAEQHRMRVIQNYYEAQAQHTQATGNPPKGSGQRHEPRKPESEEFVTLRKRLDNWKARKAGLLPEHDIVPPAAAANGAQAGFQFNQQPAQPAFPPQFQVPQYYGAAPGAVPFGLPARPDIATDSAFASSVDDLISNAKAQAASSSQPVEKKAKKDKKDNQRMIYSDNEISPEEKMSHITRYSFTPSRSVGGDTHMTG